MEELSRAGQQALKSKPFSALISARLTSLSEGKAVLEVLIREELLQQNGYVHGGVISYIAANALTFAGGSVLGPLCTIRKPFESRLHHRHGPFVRRRFS